MLNLKHITLGVATSSGQIEGGRVNSNWNDFCDRGQVKDGSDIARANQHYEKFREDTALLKDMHIQAYRLSIEWARLEPEPGKFNALAFEHYREELRLLREAGIKPFLTFHHFTHPMWFENTGGFTNPENIAIFLRYVEKSVRELGDLCDDYVTINEPNVYAVHSFLFGEWPPEKKSFPKTIKVYSIMATCHCLAYDAIHRIRREMGFTNTRVSFAHHMQVFEPRHRWNPLHKLATAIFNRLFQDFLMRACFKGEFVFPLKRYAPIPKKNYVDFIAINYYTRVAVSGFSYGNFDNVPLNDLDWEIYPEGIIKSAQTCYDCLPLPIVISENGTCDNTDSFRARYVFEHLKLMAESDLPFEAYYHWCFIDNFEWKEGEASRFGLVHCDYETQERTIKSSGHFYTEMIKQGGVDKALYDQYVKDCHYELNRKER